MNKGSELSFLETLNEICCIMAVQVHVPFNTRDFAYAAGNGQNIR